MRTDVSGPFKHLCKKDLNIICWPKLRAHNRPSMRCLQPNCVASLTRSRRLVAGIKPESDCPGRPPVPVDRTPAPLPERRLGLPPEEFFRPRDVQLSPRLAVRLRGVPSDAAAESGFPGDEAREIPNGDLLAPAEGERRGAVVLVRG